MDGLGIHPLTYVWCLSQMVDDIPRSRQTRLLKAVAAEGEKSEAKHGFVWVCECVLAPNLRMVLFFIKQVAELLLRPHQKRVVTSGNGVSTWTWRCQVVSEALVWGLLGSPRLITF